MQYNSETKEIKRYLEEVYSENEIETLFEVCPDGFLKNISDISRIKFYMEEDKSGNKSPIAIIEQKLNGKWEKMYSCTKDFRKAIQSIPEIANQVIKIEKENAQIAEIEEIKEKSEELSNRKYSDYFDGSNETLQEQKINEDYNKVDEIIKEINKDLKEYYEGKHFYEDFHDDLLDIKDNLELFYERIINKEVEKISKEMETQYDRVIKGKEDSLRKVENLEERYNKALDIRKAMVSSRITLKEIDKKTQERIQEIIKEKDISRDEDRYQGIER